MPLMLRYDGLRVNILCGQYFLNCTLLSVGSVTASEVMLARNLRRNLPDMGWMRLLHLGAGAPRMALRAGG